MPSPHIRDLAGLRTPVIMVADTSGVIAQAGQSRFQIPETGLEILDTARMVQHQYADLALALRTAGGRRC
jgi:hypothetical protein